MSQEVELSVLVTGATGQQGGAVARALLERGHAVKALTRRPRSVAARALQGEGAQIVEGSFDDFDSLAVAMRDVDSVFAMSTPFERGPHVEVSQGRTLIDAAAKSGGPHVVYSSVASADEETGIGAFDSKLEVENHLRSTGLPYTIVAPVFFMENLLSPWLLPRLRVAELALPLPRNQPLQMVALADLADFAVLAMEQRATFTKRRVEIASDELPGWRAAAILSDVIGRRIDYVEIPISELQNASVDLAKMLWWLARDGFSVSIPTLRERHEEVGWHSFEDWARMRSWAGLRFHQRSYPEQRVALVNSRG